MASLEKQEAKAYAIFKMLRNRLRKFRPDEVVHYCIRQLNPGRSFEWPEVAQRPPWFFLLLIKWTAMYGDFLSPTRRTLSESDMEQFIAALHEIRGQDLPSCYDNEYLFFRAQFQQQQWLQEVFLVPEIARQQILFLDLEPDHRFSVAFQEIHNIDLNTFLELSFALMARFVGWESYTVGERFFENLLPSYPHGTIPTFLSLFSRDLEALGRELSSKPKFGVLNEIIEPSPLLRYPLLKEKNRYHCYFVYLLFRTIQNFVYDTLRAADARAFTSMFGPIFERYLENGLSHAALEYMTESMLATKLPHRSKLVDFAVLSDDAAVLIDAKAIQFTDPGVLARTSATLADKASTALKAVDQGFAVAANLKAMGLIAATCSLFLLVVTYKDLLLGSGREFYDNAAKATIDGFGAAHGGIHPIPVDHIFFLSINDFDLLMEHLKLSGIRLADFLHKAVQDNADVGTGQRLRSRLLPP
jgi:hypothetical protein